MGRVPLDGEVARLTEPNHQWNEENVMKNDESPLQVQTLGWSDEDNIKIDCFVSQVDKKTGMGLVLPENGQKLQVQPQVPVIRWERFLPLRSLKVLLVENDDSTRQVVSALLRNCSYEVTAVANGLQAWRILEDLTNHIDLILTEVVMPVISGIALLYKIMSHKTFKNIPVIMMSSHDSMSIVFKCLSKGAVDFLVKPIRKNELKNLWQHVWRRCHSSSGSGSESGTQSRRSTGAKGNAQSQGNSSSIGERECGSIGLSLHDGSDDGSGAQSSWTKRAAEGTSPHPTGECNADAPDSTCAQVIHAKPETASNSRMHVTEVVESPEEDGQHENTSPQKKQDADTSSDPIDSDQQLERFEEQPSGTEHSKNALDFKLPETKNVTNILGNANKACANLSSINSQTERRSCEPSNGYSKFSFKDKKKFDLKEGPSLELKLEAGVSDVRTTLQVDGNILGHSDISAFSKYVSGPSASQKDSSGRPVRPGTTEDAAINSSQMEPRDLNQVYVEHHHHYYHHYHHHVHDTQKHKASKDLAKCVPKVAPLAAPQCGSSNAISGPVELNLGNYSMNGSGSGSNYGSNGQNGSSIHNPNTGTTNITCDGVMPVNNASGGCKGKTGTSGSDEDRFAHREAALTKFRQKRKERCFEKKVLYQSRKKLAEQRPRVRGQFM
uniref:Uncharacterized protein n=1 Tax=Kalanchoe fedtschenkoi TaxID=63787 RepID=A0A7N0UA89_KALFE